jgi:hypothetical protein
MNQSAQAPDVADPGPPALQSLMEGEKSEARRGIVVWLAGLNPGVLEVVRHAGLDEQLGRERMLFNARAAIERYRAMQASGVAKPPCAAS